MTRRHGKEVSSPQPRPCENVEIHLTLLVLALHTVRMREVRA
jgi:hypothetical protein